MTPSAEYLQRCRELLDVVAQQISDRPVRRYLLADPARVPVPLAPDFGRKVELGVRLPAEARHLDHRRMVAVPVGVGDPVDLRRQVEAEWRLGDRMPLAIGPDDEIMKTDVAALRVFSWVQSHR